MEDDFFERQVADMRALLFHMMANDLQLNNIEQCYKYIIKNSKSRIRQGEVQWNRCCFKCSVFNKNVKIIKNKLMNILQKFRNIKSELFDHDKHCFSSGQIQFKNVGQFFTFFKIKIIQTQTKIKFISMEINSNHNIIFKSQSPRIREKCSQKDFSFTVFISLQKDINSQLYTLFIIIFMSNKHPKKEVSSQSDSEDRSYPKDHLPIPYEIPNDHQMSFRTRRQNTTQRNYRPDFSEEESKHSSSSSEFIYFKGGRISKVLAMRKRADSNQIEKLCKFHSKSYLHTEWLTQKQINLRNIQMVKQTKRSIEFTQKYLQEIQEKYGTQHYFNPSYTKVDRILTTAVLFPIMHHKKGSQMNGKWSQMMMLVCAKILNFQKNNIPYGVIEKDDYHPQSLTGAKTQGKLKIKIEHVINRVYLDRYQTPQQFWKDVGQCINSLYQQSFQTGRQPDAQILRECIVFLYWQWFRLSKDRFLSFLPKGNQYEKIKADLESQKCQVNFRFDGDITFNFTELVKQNFFLKQNYGEIPTSQKQLLLLHPGRFGYEWLGKQECNYANSIFSHLTIGDIKKLDLNVEIDPLYLIKWCDLDYDEVTWQKESELKCVQKIENFKQYNKIPPKKDRDRIEQNKKYHKAILSSLLKEQQIQSPEIVDKYKRKLYHYYQSSKEAKQYGGEDIPVYKGYKILKNFQLEGLNWLIKSWHERRNCILADEMGLGKTIQTIAFLNHLNVFENILGPFLIVAPVSTLKQWRNQIEQWSELNCVLYKGKKQSRDLIEEYQFYHKFVTNEGIFVKFQKLPRFQVLLTNYQIFVSDILILQKIAFQHIILDEAHKMKNSQTKIAKTLKLLPCTRILLLTGTPIQNNTAQIYGLLNIIEPRRFNSLDHFKQKFGKLKTIEELTELKQILKPFLMRRVKSDVEKSIPKLSEMLVNLQLTKIQKAFYRGILEKNKNQILTSLSSAAINNISICQRLCCNHPYLVSQEVEEEITSNCKTNEQRFEKFITSSSKMIFVHKFLTKCRENKAKTLIFTQFLKMLDLLRQYCSMAGILFETLDGSVNYDERQNRIDNFNNNPNVLVFVISTKAGGVGINLTSATNIIIYDSDWNPQNDIQAIARAHRIGQHKNVSVYRLITSQTYEDILYKTAVKKLGIGLAILDNEYFNNQALNPNDKRKQKSKDEIEKLLRDGVISFLKAEQNRKEQKASIQNQSIEDIISKSSTSIDYQTKDCSFTSTKFDCQKGDNINIDDENFWEVALQKVQSPLQKLVKKLKIDDEAKKINDDVNLQLDLMIEANQIVYDFIKSKVSMSHFNAQDDRELRSFLQKITYSRLFHKKFKNLANDWLQQIEKPSRRFQKQNVNTLVQMIKDKVQAPRISRNRPRKIEEQGSNQSQNKQKRGQLIKRNARVVQSSQNQNSENNDQEDAENESQKQIPKQQTRRKNMRNIKSKVKVQKDQDEKDEKFDQVGDKKIRYHRFDNKNPETYKKQINDNLAFYLEKICSLCQRKICSKICKGRCRRSFHQICYEKYQSKDESLPTTSQIQQLKMSKEQLSNILLDSFECVECKNGLSCCFICNQPGKVIPSAWAEKGAPKKPTRYSQNSNSRNEVQFIYDRATQQQKQLLFQCRMEYCTKAYHLRCLKDLKKQLEFQMYGNKEQGSYPLKCPIHFCAACRNKLSIKKCSCLRCPISYHIKCKSANISIQQIEHEWFICSPHLSEEELERRKQFNSKSNNVSKKQKMEEKKIQKQFQNANRDQRFEERKVHELQDELSDKMEKLFKQFEVKANKTEKKELYP